MEHECHRRAGKPAGPPSAPTADAAIGGLYGRYRALRRRLADLLGSGDRDYAALSLLSQEIGAMRQRLRQVLARRRRERRAPHGRSNGPRTLPARG